MITLEALLSEIVQTTLATGPSWERGYDLLPDREKLKARRGTAMLRGKVTGLCHGLGLLDLIAGLDCGIDNGFGSRVWITGGLFM